MKQSRLSASVQHEGLDELLEEPPSKTFRYIHRTVCSERSLYWFLPRRSGLENPMFTYTSWWKEKQIQQVYLAMLA